MEISASTILDFYNSQLGKIVELETANNILQAIDKHQARQSFKEAGMVCVWGDSKMSRQVAEVAEAD